MQRRVECRLRSLLAGNLREARADLLERERVVAEKRRVLLDERECRRRALAIPLDRSRLAAPRRGLVTDRHMEHLGLVLRLARNRERLGELQAHDLGRHLHVLEPNAGCYAG